MREEKTKKLTLLRDNSLEIEHKKTYAAIGKSKHIFKNSHTFESKCPSHEAALTYIGNDCIQAEAKNAHF